DKDGIKGEKIDYMLQLRSSNKDIVEDYAKEFGAEFHAGKKPWEIKSDVALPCATQNEIMEEDAKKLVANGTMCVCEGANMPTTIEGYKVFMEAGILYSPGKASNAGGVATSGLEMTQNSMRLPWSKEEVDKRLHEIMIRIHSTCIETADRFGTPGNYVNGANIAGFLKVADAMMDQGLV
ncbi:MAG: glutamate dehydrogenase, partial [Ignavibacteriae bacterium]|nr:glutamate dehydrogenase [Ignavibacteriota bacterium]